MFYISKGHFRHSFLMLVYKNLKVKSQGSVNEPGFCVC